MKTITKLMITTLLVGSSSCVFTSAAQAAASGPNSADAKIQALEAEIQNLSNEVQDLKRSTLEQKDQYAEVQKQEAEVQKQQATAIKVAIPNGRPVLSSADGNFTFAVRALLQTDWGYYMQSAAAKSLPAAYGPDFSSGTNLRRAEIGFQGKVFGDWSYYFLYEFGNPSTEAPGHILYSHLEYDGLAPWAFRIGVYAPPSNLEDGTAGADLLFLERNSPSNMQRGIAGSEGRDAISILYMGDRLFGALSFTGGKVQDTAVFDEQQALVGRASYLLYSELSTRICWSAPTVPT